MHGFHFVHWLIGSGVKRKMHIGYGVVEIQGCFVEYVRCIQGRTGKRMAMRASTGVSRSRQNFTARIIPLLTLAEIKGLEGVLNTTQFADIQLCSSLNVRRRKSMRGRWPGGIRVRPLIIVTQLR